MSLEFHTTSAGIFAQYVALCPSSPQKWQTGGLFTSFDGSGGAGNSNLGCICLQFGPAGHNPAK